VFKHLIKGSLFLIFAGLISPARLQSQAFSVEELTRPATRAAQPEPQSTSPTAPKPIMIGYSFSSEVAPSSLLSHGTVTLDSKHPEVVLFFGSKGGTSKPTNFRYRLDGYDSDWTETLNPTAHYRRIPPGRYRFLIQTSVAGGVWESVAAKVDIEQKPFFYQTWYFYGILLLCFAALVAQLLHQRDLLLKGQMGIVLEERNRIARDCHDTLMAGFAAISWQLEATSKLFPPSDLSLSSAARSCDLARSMVAHCQEEARRIIWDLRDSDELTTIFSQALARAISAHRFSDSIKTTMIVEGREIAIAPGAIHHLVCIGQEAITNAIRHGKASSIDVRLRYEEESLSLSIRDNGHGLQPFDLKRAGHFGIAVMEERARKLGGTLRLNSTNSGTEVVVNVLFHIINQQAVEQHHVVPWVGV
jgi:signal transduction histidine kinase